MYGMMMIMRTGNTEGNIVAREEGGEGCWEQGDHTYQDKNYAWQM